MAKKVRIEDTVGAEVIVGPIEEYCTKPVYDDDGVQRSAGILSDGREEVDPLPFQPSLPVRVSDPLEELVRRYVRGAISDYAAENEFETFDEADDFDIDDDPLDKLTEYERVFDPPPAPAPTAPAVPQVAAGDSGGGAGPSQKKAPPAASDVKA